MLSVTDRRILIVAHGQPGNPGPQQAAVEALAARVSNLLGQTVEGATLAAPGALERAAGPKALVYPLFMAGGWFTTSELPRRLQLAGAVDAQILPPFGSDQGLPQVALSLMRQACRDAGFALDQASVLLAGHGSGRSRIPAQATRAFADMLAPHVARITCGFIEEAPFIADAAQGLGPDSLCLPFFATEAEHVTDDLPTALRQAGFQGITLPPLGLAPEVPAMIANALKAAP